MSSRRILVAGCGYVGTRLAGQLALDGDEVWAVRRTSGAVPTGVRPLALDLSDPVAVGRLPLDFDVVFYLASAGARDEGAYRRAYVTGLGNVLAHLETGRSRARVLFASSTAVYGQHSDEWVDEESPTEPPSFRGRILLEGEQLLAEASVSGTVARFSGIYGPRRTTLARNLLEGATGTTGDDGFTNRIHRDDCAGALAHIASLEEPRELYLVSDDEPARRSEIQHWLRARHRTDSAAGEPVPASRPRAQGIEPVVAPVNEARARRSRAGSKRCRNARLRASGYSLLFPSFRDGYAALEPGLPDGSRL